VNLQKFLTRVAHQTFLLVSHTCTAGKLVGLKFGFLADSHTKSPPNIKETFKEGS
jgi:hypothetical protein